MSYRTKVNDIQIFGNNETYPEWIEFIKTQGIEVDEDMCYKGEITDFMGALETIENIVMRLATERQERITKLNERIQKFRDEGKDEDTLSKLSDVYGGNTGLFDFSNIYKEVLEPRPNDDYNMSLFDRVNQLLDTGYMFMPHVFYKACESSLEQQDCYTVKNHFYCYQVKKGETIKFSAS